MITDPFSKREQARTSLNTGSIFRYLNGCDTHSGSNWDPMAQDGTLEGSMACLNKFTDSLHPALMDNQETGSCSILKRQSDLNHVDLVTNQQCLGQINASEFRHNYTLHMTDSKRTQLNTAQYQDICNSDTEEMEASPDAKKRKRTPETDSPHIVKKNAEVGKQKDLMQLCSEVAKEQEEHKQTSKQNPRPNMCGKQTEGQTTETPHSGEAPKGNYIHVRARKGQATNSHSLAERVRREKISERMKFLQELVPGCNKITGKAVMLDEIINYVQSLQQQVEFLSMKLATVNPELNVDIERILSKEIFHTQSGSSAFQGLGPLLAPTNPYQLEHFHGSLQRIPDMIPQFTPLAQGAVLNDFNSLLQMGFYSNAASNNFEPNGG